MASKRRTQISLEPEQYAAIQAVVSRTGRSMSAVVREAVETWLDAEAQRRRREEKWLAEARSLRNKIGQNRTAQGLSPVLTREETDRLFISAEPDQDEVGFGPDAPMQDGGTGG